MKLDGKITIFHIWADKDKIGDSFFITRLLKSLVNAINMTPNGEPKIVTYPTQELGFTAFIAVQTLYESYIIYDNWVELGYANLIVNSCKSYDTNMIIKVIQAFMDNCKVIVSHTESYDGKCNN